MTKGGLGTDFLPWGGRMKSQMITPRGGHCEQASGSCALCSEMLLTAAPTSAAAWTARSHVHRAS